MDWKQWFKRLDRLKYPLIVLAFGLVLMLLPSGSRDVQAEDSPNLAELLAATEGVGRVYAAVSEHGAVIVCEGAEKARVKLDILQAVASYTGLGADRITVLKMTDQKGR